jgi:hypothetical protein
MSRAEKSGTTPQFEPGGPANNHERCNDLRPIQERRENELGSSGEIILPDNAGRGRRVCYRGRR